MTETIHNLDDTDRRLLACLQENGRLTNQELAEAANTSPATCSRRLKALEQAGVIRRHTVLLDREKLGVSLCAIVQISLIRHGAVDVAAVEDAICAHPQVQECYAASGDADIIMRVVAHDIASYNRFLEDVLFPMEGVSQVRSNIVLRELKYEVALPV
ncbi:Lrp/AsnC family transcriptional regulator [Yunchengibacter salinarum]|uniref:Lrp/AsnC family transcriptional regulator n=1 Tax=Yunchengibacter salinarum TaxID=3133399 RepID=UPI0035B583A7